MLTLADVCEALTQTRPAGAQDIDVSDVVIDSRLAKRGSLFVALKGEVRDLVRVDDYRPKEWASHVVTARSDFAKKEPDTVKRVVRSILQATEFIGKNRDWSTGKVKLLFGFSDEAAKQIYERFHFTRDGKIGKKALENLRAYLIQYGIVSGEKIPTVEELYTEEFVG